jgi:hypothetical protein
VLIASPALALVSSPTKYDRIIQQANRIANQHANKIARAATVAAAAKAVSPVSVAMRTVAGPLGWAALGVQAGLFLYQTYYSADDLQDLKNAAGQAAATPAYIGDVPAGINMPTHQACTTVPWSCSVTYNGQTNYGDPNVYDGLLVLEVPRRWGCGDPVFPPNPPYVKITEITVVYVDIYDCATWSRVGSARGGTWVYGHMRPQGPPPPPPEPTQQQIQDFLQTLPDNDPRSLDSHSQPLGTGVEPTPAGQIETTTATPTELPTTVVPQTTVLPTDTVVQKDVPPPAGSTTTQTTTQQTTTQTTTNPDGSETQQETATASCSSASHDQRTLGSVLEEHQAKWNNAPLLSALTQLKTLAWPSSLPTVSFNSSLFGSFAVDFNAWAWVFLALKTLILAGASLAAYRIVFVGGR